MYTTTSSYACRSGIPLGTVRRYCRDRLIPRIKIGSRYYVDVAGADKALAEIAGEPEAKMTGTYRDRLNRYLLG